MSDITKEDILLKVKGAGAPIPSDRRVMKELLTNKSFLRALNMLLLESADKTDQLRTHDLTDEVFVKKALKIQGEATGLIRAVDVIIDAAFDDWFTDED